MREEIVCKISMSEELSSYMDCMLDGGSMRRISRHLKRCEECRKSLSDLMQVRASMRGIKKSIDQPSDAFWANTFRTARLADSEFVVADNKRLFPEAVKAHTNFSIRRVVTYSLAAAMVLGAIMAPFTLSGKSPAVQPAEAAEVIDVDAIVDSHANAILHAPLVSRTKTVMIESESTARQTGNTVDEAVFDIDQNSTDSPPAIR